MVAEPATDRARVEERVADLLAAFPPDTTPEQEFWGAQFDHGLAWVQFPEGMGGMGAAPGLQTVVDSALDQAGASRRNWLRNFLALGMGAATAIAHGTEAQQRRYLRPMFTTEEIWCQLFSEPGAGSDLASLAARAVRDGDEWAVNGQKVWTTLAHVAKWGMLVTRTDPEVPKHLGMTYFIVDMEAPGVEVRPLRQITGEAEFNEVYFDDVRIPDENRLGGIGDGWRVALTTLMNERVAIGSAVLPRGGGSIGEAVALWREGGHAGPAGRDELMRLWVEAEVNRLTNLRAADMRDRGTPGPEGSTAKLHWAELNKRIYDLCLDLLGPAGMLYTTYDMAVPSESRAAGERDVREAFLRSRANSIEGGTTEIMKNILGERVLGLPGEPRVDKDLPWSQVPRS